MQPLHHSPERMLQETLSKSISSQYFITLPLIMARRAKLLAIVAVPRPLAAAGK
jgi:hypothetical protein